MRRGLPTDGLGRRQREELSRAHRVQQCVVFTLVLVALCPVLAFYYVKRGGAHSHAANVFDAIVVPGGGLTADGEAPPWVRARLDKALELYEDNRDAYIILLSRGTPHKAPPIDSEGRPVDEAQVSAEYLRERSVPAQRLLQDTWSLDTIGNAVFLRLMHLEARGFKRVAVITNEFHMPRLAAIFEWVLALPPTQNCYKTGYFEVPDLGLTDEQLKTRRSKEASSLEKLHVTIESIRSLPQLHGFVFEHHGSYATGVARVPVSKELAASY
ncbi:DUF218 domain-containing protein [Pavlovales sp. CCMP2436]|nr:DUF218 domain-containing protein [Pavlovales sp. CCMP2436]|mmetsp:Transcript_11281/g.28514  ORF Transcript_11281/g.28514 Transcript_11281/m.28514 type:complete len:270 (+) Transcript_11281:68-877(+)